MRAPVPSIRWTIIAVVCLTFAVRFSFLVLVARNPQRALVSDSGTYTQLAQGILQLHEFRGSPDAGPDIHRTPGYPLFLAVLYPLSSSPVAVSILQILLTGLSASIVVWLTYRLARSSYERHTLPCSPGSPRSPGSSTPGRAVNETGVDTAPRNAALLAGILVALDPLSAAYACLILTEHLFGVLLICATVILIVPCLDYPSKANGRRNLYISLSGFISALNTIIRPIGLFVAVAQVPYLWLKARSRKVFIQAAVALLVSSLLFPALWIVRNGIATGAYTLSDIGSVNLYFYRAAAVIAELENRPFSEVQKELREEIKTATLRQRLSPPQTLHLMNRNATAILLDHPFLVLKHATIGALRMLLGPGKAVFEQIVGTSDSKVVLPLIGWSWLHLALVYMLAARYVFTSKQNERWLFLATIVYFCLLSAGPEAYSRFRAPLMPVFCVMAGMGGLRLSRRGHAGGNSISHLPREET